MKIYGISVATFERSLAIIQGWDLLGNDALHIACMEEHSIGAIATYDRNFSRVSGIPHFSFPSATPQFSKTIAPLRNRPSPLGFFFSAVGVGGVPGCRDRGGNAVPQMGWLKKTGK